MNNKSIRISSKIRSKKSPLFGHIDTYLVRELKSNPDVQGAALELALLHLRLNDEGSESEQKKLETASLAIHDRCCVALGIVQEHEDDLSEAALLVVNDLAFDIRDAVLKSLGNPRLAEVNLRSFLRSN